MVLNARSIQHIPLLHKIAQSAYPCPNKFFCRFGEQVFYERLCRVLTTIGH